MSRHPVPQGWARHKIRDVASVGNGSTPSRKQPRYWDQGQFAWLPTGKVHDRVITQADEFITQAALDESSARIFPANSVLVSMIGQGLTRGMAAYLAIDAAINQNFACVVPDADLDSWFLFHYLDSSYGRLRYASQGSNQGALNCSLIEQFPIIVPPLAEQHRIAAILSTWDEAIALTEQLIAALERRKRGLMQRLLTGEVALSRI